MFRTQDEEDKIKYRKYRNEIKKSGKIPLSYVEWLAYEYERD